MSAAGYELVQPRHDSGAVHARSIARRGAQHPSLCGKLAAKDLGPVAADPFSALWSQITCVPCKRALDRMRP